MFCKQISKSQTIITIAIYGSVLPPLADIFLKTQ